MKKKTSESKPKISIIVPVYNVQGYLGKCLNSLLAQTLKDIEIICVNDGSTDDSLAILQNFAARDKRIKLIDKENSGVSAARNAGLDVATGEYVMFVDGDDWIEPKTCEECYEKITTDNADLLLFNFQDVFSQEHKKVSNNLKKLPENKTFVFSDCPEDFFYVQTSIWGKLFKFQPKLKLNETLKKGEDSVYFWEYCLKYNPQISVLNKVFYNYLQRADSAMKSDEFVDDCEILKSVYALIAKNCFKKASPYIQAHILDRFASSLCWEINHTKMNLPQSYFKRIQTFVELFSEYPDLENLRYYPKLRDLAKIWNRKIDLVYLWVNGNDKEWQKKKNYWMRQYGLPVNDTDNQECRFIDNQELRYSLRSAEMFAPWINQIFIITNGQIPEWLDANNPKIKIITHEQIMPQDALPTFNASAIEACLSNIPGLSEYFLFSNDDFFFGQLLSPAYFFDAEGKPIIRMVEHNWSPNTIHNLFYQNVVYYSKELIRKKLHKDFGNLACIHNIVPYRKSMFAACAQEFIKDFDYAAHCKFREKNIVQRTIVTFYTMAKMNIEPQILNIHEREHHSEAIVISLSPKEKIFNRLAIVQPFLFCINDNENTTNTDRLNLKDIMAVLFPKPQKWEKDYGANGSLLVNKLLQQIVITSASTKQAGTRNPTPQKSILSYKLFHFFPLYTYKKRGGNQVWKLFGIPIWRKRKFADNQTIKYYLFGLPLIDRLKK